MTHDPNKIDRLDPPKVDPMPGGYRSSYGGFEKFVDSRMFITFARLIMLFAGGIGLPVAGYFMTRLITAADNITAQVGESAVEIRLLKSDVKAGFDRSKEDINRHGEFLRDHEGRIRVLERVTPLPSRPN